MVDEMINKRKLKLLWRNNAFKASVGLFVVFLLAFIIFQESEKSPLTSRKRPKDYDFNDIESETPLFLAVLIMTGPANVDRRNAIRETWLSRDAKAPIVNDVKHFFVIGVKDLPSKIHNRLMLEQNLHHDLLLLEDFEDSYNKLTEKLGRMLQWLDEHHSFEFLLKADDDTYVRLDKVVRQLKTDVVKTGGKSLYWGYFYGRGRVKQSGPWKETNWKLCDYYLPYARGGGYVLSSNLVKYVSKNWHQFEMYMSEDVSLGAWLAPLKLTKIHDIRFDTEYKSRGCKNSYIVTHKQSIDEMVEKYNNIKSLRKMCTKESTSFPGYQYDWNVPPSQCCVRNDGIP